MLARPEKRLVENVDFDDKALHILGFHTDIITSVQFEGIRGGYASAKQNFPRKTGTAAVRDHGITTRRADAAEPSRCRRTRRG
jgi:hypothetical protein